MHENDLEPKVKMRIGMGRSAEKGEGWGSGFICHRVER